MTAISHSRSQSQQVGPVLSLVVPMFNESGNVDGLFARLTEVLAGLDVSYEIVCVDDGSRDDTVARLVDHHRRDPRIKVVELSRNFGKEPGAQRRPAACRRPGGGDDRRRPAASARADQGHAGQVACRL
ncbi:MAG: glycosyltransferase [Magnetospirillum sp.]|nr:glycosyltransferase [Magnetospirillum sp.]